MSLVSLDQPVLGNILMRHVVSPLMQGKFSMSETALLAIAISLLHVEQTIEETCRILGNCDPRTIRRWEDDPTLDFPHHHKSSGGKITWWLDELESWKQSHLDRIRNVKSKHH